MTRACLWLLLALASSWCQAQPAARFSFAIVGDTPYTAWEEDRFVQMLHEINQNNLAFVVHVGDIKNGASPCTDALYEEYFKTHDYYVDANGIAYQAFEAKPQARRVMSYSDNFSFKRRDAWTH